jgi:hypothetical protein
VARPAATAPDTNNVMNFVVRLLAALAVPDDGSIPTQGTPTGQHGQRERASRVGVVFWFWQCDKENQRLA